MGAAAACASACGDDAAAIDAAVGDPDAPVGETPDADTTDASTTDATPPDADTTDATPQTGPIDHYVTRTLVVTTSSQQAQQLGFDVDLDPQGRIDNALGGVFASLNGQGIAIGAANGAAVTAGQIIALHVFEADPLATDENTTW